MKKLQADKSTTNGIQAMRVDNWETVSEAISTKEFTDEEPELVDFVALEDSCWVRGPAATVAVPADLESGHAMLAGMSYPKWIFKGEKIAVKGKINISW